MARADLTFVNTPVYDHASPNKHLPKVCTATLAPGYETINKDSDDRTRKEMN